MKLEWKFKENAENITIEAKTENGAYTIEKQEGDKIVYFFEPDNPIEYEMGFIYNPDPYIRTIEAAKEHCERHNGQYKEVLERKYGGNKITGETVKTLTPKPIYFKAIQWTGNNFEAIEKFAREHEATAEKKEVRYMFMKHPIDVINIMQGRVILGLEPNEWIIAVEGEPELFHKKNNEMLYLIEVGKEK